jgi:hypothetical protein
MGCDNVCEPDHVTLPQRMWICPINSLMRACEVSWRCSVRWV